MPCEGQQLPYNPKFIREPEVSGQGNGGGSMGGQGSVYGPGPVAAAASVLIAPSPGGQAGPHNAIPALPDAGYTAPGIRATTLGLDYGAPSSMGAGSVMGDPYGQGPHAYGATRPVHTYDAFSQAGQGQGHGHGHGQYDAPSSYTPQGYQPNYAPSSYTHAPPMSTISSASWVDPNSRSTFPAPRRASNQALVPPVEESTIAPGAHRHAPIDPRHTHNHDNDGHTHHDDPHKQHSKTHHRTPSAVDDWETNSDALYYARPKARRTQSGSSLSDITTTTRYRHLGTPRGSPGLHAHGHSPSSPSPLRERDLDLENEGKSPISPRSHLGPGLHDRREGRKISGLGLGVGGSEGHEHASPYKPITPITTGPDYTAAPSVNERHRHHSASYDHDRQPRSVHGHTGHRQREGYASDDEGRRSAHGHAHSHRGRDHERVRRDYDDHSSTTASIPRQDKSRRQSGNRAEAYPDDSVHGHHHQHRNDRDDSRSQTRPQSHSHKHHRPRSHSQVPPPLPYRHPSPDPYQAHQHGQGQGQSSLQVPHRHMPDMGNLSLTMERERDGARRRARSMQHNAHVPSPGSLAGFGGGGGPGSVIGSGQGMYGPLGGMGGMGGTGGSIGGALGPGMGAMGGGMGGGMEGYDDSASAAGSAMTFMDGTMGGKTSQYGLPKYPHQAKPDPRRFMVQRGKADVYLD